jgi:hypothetical protein
MGISVIVHKICFIRSNFGAKITLFQEITAFLIEKELILV